MRPLALLSIAALALTGCGHDPREAFVGVWQMAGKTTTAVTVGGQTQNETSPNTPGPYGFASSASNPSEIEWKTSGCDWSADVTTDQSFTINRNVCPPTSGSCVLTITITQGIGTRTGDNLAIDARGDIVGNCGASSVTGTILYELTGTKSTR